MSSATEALSRAAKAVLESTYGPIANADNLAAVSTAALRYLAQALAECEAEAKQDPLVPL